MTNFEVIIVIIAILEPIAIGLLGWILVKLNKLDREVGINTKDREDEQSRDI